MNTNRTNAKYGVKATYRGIEIVITGPADSEGWIPCQFKGSASRVLDIDADLKFTTASREYVATLAQYDDVALRNSTSHYAFGSYNEVTDTVALLDTTTCEVVRTVPRSSLLARI